MIIFYSTDIDAENAILVDQEAKHCTRVLRKKEGDVIYVTDGLGNLYQGPIISMSKRDVTINPLNIIEKQEKGISTGIAIAPTKNSSRYEWFLEKAVEIGVSDVFPILTKRTEKSKLKMDRLQAILISAMKQSKNFHLPTLHVPIRLEQFIAPDYYTEKYIGHCMDAKSHLLNMYDGKQPGLVMIGPEGDFTKEEVKMCIDKGFIETNLGPSRLRTETAGVVATHLLQIAITSKK